MTDVILQLSQNKLARTIVARAKLPIPLPEKLQRPEGPSLERMLEDETVVVGDGELSGDLARVLSRAGAQTLAGSPRLAQAFAGPGEAYGRSPRSVEPAALDTEHLDAIVFDATAFAGTSDLKQLYAALHPTLRALTENGRTLVLG